MLMDTRPPRGSGGNEPWRGEPNRVQWRDASTGFQCLILRSHLGTLCGYVRVPRDHALHGKSYTQRAVYRNIEVHGGLTFSGCIGGRRMKRGHWFGFDCGHMGDVVPVVAMFRRHLPEHLVSLFFDMSSTYRNVDYVRAECTALALQLSSERSYGGVCPIVGTGAERRANVRPMAQGFIGGLSLNREDGHDIH